jgi:hypothetical protein
MLMISGLWRQGASAPTTVSIHPSRGKGAQTPTGGGKRMASSDRGAIGGLSLGGVLIIIGIVVAIIWSFWAGLIIALIGLIAFGGFARGRWY